jgi:hypothetical protein
MVMFYSAATNGFYPEDMRSMYDDAGTWPADAAEISDETYNTLMTGQASGQEIVPGDDGSPALVTPEVDHQAIFGTQKELLQMEAECVIAPLERAVKYGLATDEEKLQLEAWEKYSVLVNRVQSGEAWPPKPE